jgi:hypothetical protein
MNDNCRGLISPSTRQNDKEESDEMLGRHRSLWVCRSRHGRTAAVSSRPSSSFSTMATPRRRIKHGPLPMPNASSSPLITPRICLLPSTISSVAFPDTTGTFTTNGAGVLQTAASDWADGSDSVLGTVSTNISGGTPVADWFIDGLNQVMDLNNGVVFLTMLQTTS